MQIVIYDSTMTDQTNTPLAATDFLPLKPAVLLILMALAEQPRHGYAIAVAVREQSGCEVDLGTSHLYRHLKKLLEHSLVAEVEDRPDDDDSRRRYYRLTDFGRQVLGAEIERLEALVRLGRNLQLVPGVAP
jgi:DNA-binding PadR family transcriptional regulator